MYVLRYKLEQLRTQLINLTLSTDSFTDERVIRLSEELDKYIVEYQKSMLRPSPYYTTTSLG